MRKPLVLSILLLLLLLLSLIACDSEEELLPDSVQPRGTPEALGREVVILSDTPTPTLTPTPTRTPTPEVLLRFTSMDGTPTQVPILMLGFANSAAATPGATATPTTTPTTTPTALVCVQPTPIATVIVGASTPGSATPLGSEDTFICGQDPTENFGNQSVMSLNDDCSILIKWPLPAEQMLGKTVTDATLRLFVVGQPVANMGASVFFVNPLLVRWTELGATWQSPRPGATWTVDGALGAGTDYSVGVVGYMYVDGSTIGWFDIDILPSTVNSWLTMPASNHGVLIWSATARNNLRLTSSEWFNPAFRPQLLLTLE